MGIMQTFVKTKTLIYFEPLMVWKANQLKFAPFFDHTIIPEPRTRK
jgi:hypothetical protein